MLRTSKYPHRKTEDFDDDLNLRKIGIRGKSGMHKNDLRLMSFRKILQSRPNLTFIDLSLNVE